MLPQPSPDDATLRRASSEINLSCEKRMKFTNHIMRLFTEINRNNSENQTTALSCKSVVKLENLHEQGNQSFMDAIN